jgi:hypothetical protein
MEYTYIYIYRYIDDEVNDRNKDIINSRNSSTII